MAMTQTNARGSLSIVDERTRADFDPQAYSDYVRCKEQYRHHDEATTSRLCECEHLAAEVEQGHLGELETFEAQDHDVAADRTTEVFGVEEQEGVHNRNLVVP